MLIKKVSHILLQIHILFFIVYAILNSLAIAQQNPYSYANQDDISNDAMSSLLHYHRITKDIQTNKEKLVEKKENPISHYMDLVKGYGREISPHIFNKNTSNTLQLSFWEDYWQIGSGRKYQIDTYETHVFLYGEQLWDTFDTYGLLEQRKKNCDENPTGCIHTNVYNDLRFVLSSVGIGATVYYLTLFNNNVAFGFEAPLFSFYQLRIYSTKANNNFRINGIALLGMPVWRHGVITPLKIRYAPSNWLSVVASVKYASYTLYHQGGDEYNPNIAGDWIDGCDKKECTVQTTSGQIGFEMLF